MIALDRLADRWPLDADADPALDRALESLGADVDAATLMAASRAVGATLALVAAGLAAGLLAVGGRATVVVASLLGVGGVAAGVLLPDGVAGAVRFRAALRRTRALGAAAELVGRMALRLRIDPTVEGAVAFAGRTGRGTLARSLDRHVDRTAGTARTGLDAFAATWGDSFPALERAAVRLEAAATAPADERDRHLDRAVEAALDGVREELASFATEIRGPVTGLYAFGVLLPLALVGVLPAARATGVHVPLAAVVVLYDLCLPLAVATVGAWLLARRPVAFPPPRIGVDHPDTPDDAAGATIVGVAVAALAGVVANRVVGPWIVPVVVAGVGPGVGLAVHFRPARAVRSRVRDVEADLDDARYLVGRRVADGEAVETAIADAADRVAGTTGDLLADAAERQRRLGLTVSESFDRVTATLPSRRIEAMAATFGLAASEGRPAGKALVSTAEHVTELRRVEREARRDLARVTDTLANTATVFGPLVGGATVALSARVATTGPTAGFGASPLPTPELGVAVGAYVLWLSVALTTLSTGLTRGLDRSLVGFRVGVALSLATVCYVAAYVGAGLFL